jgi:nicotinamidase-related amidase
MQMNKYIAVSTNMTLILATLAARQMGWASTSSEAPTTLRALYGLKAPERFERAKTALVLVDFQEEFFSGKLRLPHGARAAVHAAELLEWARHQGILVVHVRNVVARPGSPIFAPDSPTSRIIRSLTPGVGEAVVTKSMVGAFSRTELDRELRARQIDTILVAGLMTHLAVQATAIDATVLGYRVVVASDASATRALPGAGGYTGVDAELLQRAALAGMADRVADVLPVRQITRLQVQ